MASVVVSLFTSLRFVVRSRAAMHLEIIALRHQLVVVSRSRRPRHRFTSADRILSVWLSQAWRGWRSAVQIVRPETVLAHRTMPGARAMTNRGNLVASFSIGLRPWSAIEKRS